MKKYDKLVFQILRGMSDANIAFTDLVNLLKHLGFDIENQRKSSCFQEEWCNREDQFARKKATKQSPIKFAKYAILYSNTN